MEKQKRWQFYLIVAVIVLTLINILPTVFYYTKPLKSPVDEQRAETVAKDIIHRVNGLEADSKAWLLSFSKNLGLKPESINLRQDDQGLYEMTFKNGNDAALFKRFLPRAGSLIPFVPAQLELYTGKTPAENVVLVSRKINVHMDPADVNRYFHYFSRTEDGKISEQYRSQVDDRAVHLALGFGGTSKQAMQLSAIAKNGAQSKDLAINLARELVDITDTFGENSSFTKRYLNSFSQTSEKNGEALISAYASRLESIRGELEKEKNLLESLQKQLESENKFLENTQEQRLTSLRSQYKAVDRASQIVKKQSAVIKEGKKPFTSTELLTELNASWNTLNPKDPLQVLDVKGHNPYIKALAIDWGNNVIKLDLYEDVQTIRLSKDNSEEAALAKDKMNQLLINEIARVSSVTDETIAPSGDEFSLEVTSLSQPESFLAFDLGYLSEQQSKHLINQLLKDWNPEHTDLERSAYPVISYEEMNPQEQKLGLVIYAPAASKKATPAGFKATSIYVIARGLDAIIQKYRENPTAPGAEELNSDLEQLVGLLKNNGFISYAGSSFGIDPAFKQDLIFELDDYYTTLLNATRENFYVKGSKKNALLDFTDVEQRIITTNRIEDAIQEDLLKWRDEYNASQVAMEGGLRYDVAPPTKNVYWENLKLSARKYFRGDDRKILKWGLDLSGGKTVRIGLKDQNNRMVTDPESLKQAVNELYVRINKMGVAERTIRIENENIILDFPGSQAFSAAELVQASAMYFHIVNEKFSTFNPNLREESNQFLQNVWNEAVVTNRKDAQSINEIAWEQLGGNLQTGQMSPPRNEAAKMLQEQGLRLANPRDAAKKASYDDSLSSIAVMRGDDYSEWEGQTHPLLIVFHNFALEGSSLSNVQVGYDPSEGNILSFGVKSSYDSKDKAGSTPRDDFYAWTSQFSEEKISGTPKEAYSQGKGWRMAVLLNDQVITQPRLRASLRDAATISGRFTQREINQLAADLKAGSLSFTPRILSEQNVSAELGQSERTKGITASFIGVILVAAAMIAYYRFSGVVATCAVIFNLLIMWGVLQNLGAALTLPGIAGIVLTIGMAVDANVLVFERIREEFALSGRIATAIQAGYRKAFSAIVDSNITTIIAALILIQFDSGPIKGFAVTLIVGLVSSMFTSLFMTRYFFAGWVQNPKNKELNMLSLVGKTHFDFLGHARKAAIASLAILAVGGFFFYSQSNTMLGMDFTGGYSLITEIQEVPSADDDYYRQTAAEALIAQGASPTDFEIRLLSKPNDLRIQLSLSMEEPGHPFNGLPTVKSEGEFEFEYQRDPRIEWVVSALNSKGLQIQTSDLQNLDTQWSMMSGQFSETMRDNAVYALGLALLSILIYITLRFEFKFAIASVVALVHDVAVSLGIFAFFSALGFAVQIDLEVVGAIMTIIGYALNDKIIVFDRIREDLRILRKLKYADIINHAINVTLSRTIMTGGTTLLVLLSLVILGGHSIFDFALMMTIGVVVGTYSSFFIAPPVLLYFHNREERLGNHEVAFKKA